MDFFSRQRTVPDWHQPLIERQVALVLGVGGIGCTVARALCRLGVSRVVLLDNDVVSASNVNRQVLYAVSDVGKRKVDAAVDGLYRDNIHTKVTAVHCDAVKEWACVVQLARGATVIFNCIDYGEYFDCAVSSLCVSLGLPYVTASSYGHTAITECYPQVDNPQRGPCWVCNNAPARVDIVDQITPDKINELVELQFLPKDVYMPSTQDIGSSILPCSLAATLATGAWLNSLHGYVVPNWMSCDFVTFQMFSYQSEHNVQCLVCQRAPRYSPLIVDIYYGNDVVKMSSVPGDTVHFTPGRITNPATETLYESAKGRLKSVCVEGGTSYFLPAIPAADLDLGPAVDGSPALPSQLASPLIKTKDGPQTAIRSGGRSCIIPLAGGCYRLKGCGNYVDAEGMRHAYPGFPVVKMKTCDEGSEIYGCCFKHTALTEQYMSHLVGELLSESEIVMGNRPVGMWRYNIPEEPAPLVAKYCGLFETLGERRVGSHLVPGLEALVSILFPSITMEEVLVLFPEERLVTTSDGQGPKVKPTWSACSSGSVEIFFSKQSYPVHMCRSHYIPETPPSSCPPKEIPPRFLGAWSQSAYTLRQSLPLTSEDTLTFGSLLALVYWEVGWEMGVVKRKLEGHRINWGYFFDHNPFEPHCNSHPNNFIVLPPGHKCLVAPVDFDLSFQESGFFSPYTGSHDPGLFESWMRSELVELERGIGGDTANTGVAMTVSQEMSLAHEALCWAFRDTMVLGYRAGYTAVDKVIMPDRLRGSVDALIRMALILTHSFNA